MCTYSAATKARLQPHSIRIAHVLEGEDKHTHTEELLDGCEELLDGCEEVDESKRYKSTKMSTAVEKALGRTIAKRPAPNLLSDFSWGYL